MSDDKKGPEGYVNRVRKETQTYILELLEENEKLRQRNVILEKNLSEAEEESHRFSSRFVEVEEQNNNLASLFVASHQLHQTMNRHEVLTALQEIIINLIGSEDFAIFERSPKTGELTEAASFGIESNRLKSLDLRSGPIAEAAESGELYLVDSLDSSGASDLVACIPMRLGSQVRGVIAIFALLSHKNGLEPLDHELFDLLASHAASSLYVSQLHEENVRRAVG